MYIHTLSSYNSRNTTRGRIVAIPEKEQRPRHCIMSAQTKSESPFPLSASLIAARTLSPLRVTGDDGNNSCLVFPHMSTCVCEPTQRVREVRLRNRHISRDLHAIECVEGRRMTRAPPSVYARWSLRGSKGSCSNYHLGACRYYWNYVAVSSPNCSTPFCNLSPFESIIFTSTLWGERNVRKRNQSV